MTIALSLLFRRKSTEFPSILGMPAGIWSATGEEEGDASGGSQTFQHIFSNPSNRLGDSNLYSIEQVFIASSNPANVGALLTLNGMDVGSGRVGTPDDPVNRAVALEIIDADTGTTGSFGVFRRAIAARDANPHLWVGTFQGNPTDFGDVLIRMENATASFSISAALYGYWWTPDAINSPRGLLRPPEYFFSP